MSSEFGEKDKKAEGCRQQRMAQTLRIQFGVVSSPARRTGTLTGGEFGKQIKNEEVAMELTARQREVFDFIQAFIKERGYPPSIREIGAHFHIYPRAVFDHLKALERKGYLKRQGSMSRGLEILVFEEDRLRKGGRPLIRDIPVLGRVAAGKPTLAVEHVEETIPLPTEWVKGREVFLLKVKGDSMSPYILPGDYVIVRSQPSAENGDVVVTLMGDEATVWATKEKVPNIAEVVPYPFPS